MRLPSFERICQAYLCVVLTVIAGSLVWMASQTRRPLSEWDLRPAMRSGNQERARRLLQQVPLIKIRDAVKVDPSLALRAFTVGAALRAS
jgi:hypothetical protein